MNCDEALLAISAALDGELPPGSRAKLSEHLLQCETCRALAKDLRVLTEELEQSDREVPPELAESIRAAVAGEAPAPKRRRAPYLRAVAAMLALCVCLGGAGLFVSGQRTKSKADTGEASLFQAAPESWEKSANGSIDDGDTADGAGGYSADAEGAPEVPMEAALTPSPEEIPLPMPSTEPDSNAETSDEYQETAPGSAAWPPDAVITFGRLPEGWEELFPDRASPDAMQVPVEEARAFLQLLKEQGITYEIELSDEAEASGVSELSDLDGNSLCQLLLTVADE